MTDPLSIDDIRAAASRIAGHARVTPCEKSYALSALTGADVWLKYDSLQVTGSFKFRGALNTLSQLSDDDIPDRVPGRDEGRDQEPWPRAPLAHLLPARQEREEGAAAHEGAGSFESGGSGRCRGGEHRGRCGPAGGGGRRRCGVFAPYIDLEMAERDGNRAVFRGRARRP